MPSLWKERQSTVAYLVRVYPALGAKGCVSEQSLDLYGGYEALRCMAQFLARELQED